MLWLEDIHDTLQVNFELMRHLLQVPVVPRNMRATGKRFFKF